MKIEKNRNTGAFFEFTEIEQGKSRSTPVRFFFVVQKYFEEWVSRTIHSITERVCKLHAEVVNNNNNKEAERIWLLLTEKSLEQGDHSPSLLSTPSSPKEEKDDANLARRGLV